MEEELAEKWERLGFLTGIEDTLIKLICVMNYENFSLYIQDIKNPSIVMLAYPCIKKITLRTSTTINPEDFINKLEKDYNPSIPSEEFIDNFSSHYIP